MAGAGLLTRIVGAFATLSGPRPGQPRQSRHFVTRGRAGIAEWQRGQRGQRGQRFPMMRGDGLPLWGTLFPFLYSKKLSKFSTGGPRFFPLRYNSSPPKSRPAVASEPVGSQLTVWLSLLAFTGRDWSGLYLTRNRVARCYFGF
jgi:hypothetical protein